jgi:hypothetical protein
MSASSRPIHPVFSSVTGVVDLCKHHPVCGSRMRILVPVNLADNKKAVITVNSQAEQQLA